MAEKKENRIKQFVEDHWVELSIVAGVALIGLGYLGLRHLPKSKQTQVVKSTTQTTLPKVEYISKELPYKNLWENFSGESLTPTKLGNEVRLTAQKINKRLVEHGLQERTPCGEYSLTELGEKFGTNTWKTTKSGHSFSNIEWDKRVIDLIFTAEELESIREFNDRIAKIMAA